MSPLPKNVTIENFTAIPSLDKHLAHLGTCLEQAIKAVKNVNVAVTANGIIIKIGSSLIDRLIDGSIIYTTESLAYHYKCRLPDSALEPYLSKNITVKYKPYTLF